MPRTSKGHKRGSSRTKRASHRMRRTHRRHRTHRRRGGADALEGAPLKYDLAGSWPSRMSLGQGTDYFKYHEGQHGGMTSDANMSGAPLKAITDSMLPEDLQMSAHTRGTLEAIDYVRQFKDPGQAGGRRCKCGKKHCNCNSKRRNHCKKHGKKHCNCHRKSHKCHHKRHRHSRKRGGNLEYAPFPNKGMLLDSQKEYTQAGLNPEWKTDPAFRAAYDRSQQ